MSGRGRWTITGMAFSCVPCCISATVSWVIGLCIAFVLKVDGPAQSRRLRKFGQKRRSWSQKRGILNKNRNEKRYLVNPGQNRTSPRIWFSAQYDFFRTFVFGQKGRGYTLFWPFPKFLWLVLLLVDLNTTTNSFLF